MTDIKLAPAAPTAELPAEEPVRGGWLAVASLGWLLFALLFYRVPMAGHSGDYNLVVAGVMLPLLAQASIVAGAAVGLWAVSRFKIPSRVPRLLTGLAAGLVTGAAASGAILLASGMPGDAVKLMAIAIAAAAGLGGLLGAAKPVVLVLAGVTSALSVLVFLAVIALFSPNLLKVFGADGTPAGNYAANGLLAGTIALLGGILAGYVGYRRVRSYARSAAAEGGAAGAAAPGWPVYAAAGGLAGLLLMLADLFTRLAAPRLLALASADVTADRWTQQLAASSRLNTGLVVLFIGAIAAIIAFGRTLPKRSADTD